MIMNIIPGSAVCNDRVKIPNDFLENGRYVQNIHIKSRISRLICFFLSFGTIEWTNPVRLFMKDCKSESITDPNLEHDLFGTAFAIGTALAVATGIAQDYARVLASEFILI